MKPMETIQDLIEEAKLRTVWWGLCIFCVTYFLSHTSKSMLMNIPVAILLVSALRILFNEVEFRQKHRPIPVKAYLSVLEKKQIPVNDSRISTLPPPANWKSKIDSPVVEAAAIQFIDKILKEFVIDLWYSDITRDRDFPEQIRGIILDAIGEIAVRVKEINLVDILTRDIVDMIGDHIDVFRRIQAAIGTDVMGTLSSEERDERLKYQLTVSKELHPALVSPENEYKVLQQLIGGVIASVLRPREAQVPVVRSIARELVTCLVVQPLLNFANPAFVNEILEMVFLALKDDVSKIFGFGGDQLVNVSGKRSKQDADVSSRMALSSVSNEHTEALLKNGHQRGLSLDCNMIQEEKHPKASEWARGLEAASLRRTEVLMPENLENMWSKGRNYKRKEAKKAKKIEGPFPAGSLPNCEHGKEHNCGIRKPFRSEEKSVARLNPSSILDNSRCLESDSREEDFSLDKKELFFQSNSDHLLKDSSSIVDNGKRSRLKRSNSLSALKASPESKKNFTRDCAGLIKSEFYSPDLGEKYKEKNVSEMAYSSDGLHPSSSKLRCRVRPLLQRLMENLGDFKVYSDWLLEVMGAYFDKLESKSFAVYSIAVTDTESRTWFVMRRYSNFERLHRQLKEIPNYILHLPPKRIFSSSTEDSFVHQRCIQLDKYLQDVLSIANVAEQHEVWDFLSASSKNYSFGMSSSEMRTLAVHVDDAVDDIVRHFKGASNDVMRSIMAHAPSPYEPSDPNSGMNHSYRADDTEKHVSRQSTADTLTSASDSDEVYRDGSHDYEEEGGGTIMAAEWHSDNELNFKVFPPRVVKRGDSPGSLKSRMRQSAAIKSELTGRDSAPAVRIPTSSNPWGDPDEMPPEWAPPNVCVPMLNLVDKVFQLKRRGWLRRQVFWMSKQILQLVMEDAIDDWLLGQIQWLRNAETIAQGIRWAQDLLWPGGTFFISLRNNHSNVEGSPLSGKLFDSAQFGSGRVSKQGTFESQLEAARRASDVKKMLFNAAPTALVSFVGPKQYKRCASDIYYFSQSTICIKQLTYGIVELLLVSVFPELRELVADVRHQMAPHNNPKKGADQI